MSQSIDKRVVEMRFNNKDFENNVRTSMKTLSNLKQGLKLEGATRGLTELKQISRGFSLNNIASSIDTISSRFSTLGIMGVTALQNITNAAVNAGKRMLSSLTIDPIMAGFQEYETQMNAVQTILANTQGGNKRINQQAVAAIKETAAIATQAATEAAQNSRASAARGIARSHEERLDAFKEVTEKELDILEDKHDKAQTALDKAIDQESKTLNEAHREKLKLYAEEYMQKLKVIDEERYNKLKAIDNEINAINDLTEAEEKALELEEDRRRLAELEERVRNAPNIEARRAAEQNLSDFRARIERKRLLEEREVQIDTLKIQRDAVEEEYDKAAAQLKAEHDEKVTKENERHKIASDNLTEYHKEREKTLNSIHKKERDFLKEKHEDELQKINERRDAAISGLGAQQNVALKHIEERKNAELQALVDASQEQTEGSTLEDVNKALDELNRYADKTIYNFTEMARNIGTFTAAGIDLETSVSAIKGIANLAAVSGSNAQQASTAMYQLSQALATGTVRLMDWNSVVNAGMGGKVFQDALKETARVHGIEIDKIIMQQGSFRDSLQSGWLTSEILLDTLAKFTGDLTEEQLKAKGYTEDQIAEIIKLGDMANDAATKVRTFTQLMGTLREAAQSGWANTWEIIIGDFEEAKTLLTNISDVVGGFIGRSADARNEMLQIWKDLGGRTELLKGLENIFNGLVQILKPISEAFREIFPPMIGEQLYKITKGFRILTEYFTLNEEQSGKIKRAFKGLFAVADILWQAISAIVKGVTDLFSAILPAGEGILSFTANLGDWFVALNESIRKTGIFIIAVEKVGDIIQQISSNIKKYVDIIIKSFESFSGIDSVFKTLHLKSDPLTKLGETTSNIFDKIQNLVKDMIPIFYNLSRNIGDVFGKIQENILKTFNHANFLPIFDIINSTLFAGILLGLRKFIDSLTGMTDSASGFLGNITGILDGVKGSLEAYQKSIKANVLLKIAISIGILAAALLILSSIDQKKLTASLTAMGVMFTQLFGSMGVFNKVIVGQGFLGMKKMAIVMIGVSIAILILASALKQLSGIKLNELTDGLVAIGLMMGMLVVVAKNLSLKSGIMIKGAAGFIVFAASLLLLTNVVKNLSQLNMDDLTTGLIGVGVLMAQIALFMKITDLSGMGIKKGVGLLAMSAALLVLSSAVKQLSEINWKNLGKGLLGIGVLLTQITLFIKFTGDAQKVISTAIGLILLGVAIKIFASSIEKLGNLSLTQIAKGLLTMSGVLTAVILALQFIPPNIIILSIGLLGVASALIILSEALIIMGGMSWKEIAKGLIVLSGSLTIIAIAMKFMTTALAGAAALLVISFALTVLSKVLTTLGSMSLSEIGKALLALAGVFVVLGVATLVLSPVVPVLLTLSAAIFLFGLAALAAGVGVLMFSTGLAALAVSGTAGAAALVLVVTSLIGLIPMVFEQIGKGLIKIAQVITEGAPIIIKASVTSLSGILEAIVIVMPKIEKAISSLVRTLLTILIDNVPLLVDSGLKLLMGFLKGIADNITKIVEQGVNITINFIKGINSKLPDIIDAAFKLIISFINGLASAIRNNNDAIFDACENLIDAIINSISKMLDRLPALGISIIEGLIDGVSGMTRRLANSVRRVVSGAIDGVKDLLGINSPSRVFTEIGIDSGTGLIVGLEKMGSSVSSTASKIGQDSVESMQKGLKGMSNALTGEIDLQPVIRPIVDMTDVQNGINSVFGRTHTIRVDQTTSRIPRQVIPQGTMNQNIADSGVTTTNNQATIHVTNNYTVRNDNDIRKISQDQKNLLDRYSFAKGVAIV